MKPLKHLLVLAAVAALGAHASASFELGLFGTSNLVYRYDVENHISLGSFGQGKISGLRSVVSQQSTSEAYVLHAGGKGVAVFDYSTGSYKRGLGFGTSAAYSRASLGLTGNILASGGYSTTQEFAVYDGTTGALQSFRTLAAGYTALDFLQMPNGFYYGLAKRPGTSAGYSEYALMTYTSVGATPISTTVITTTNFPNYFRELISSGNQFNVTGDVNVPSSNYFANVAGGFTPLNTWSTPFGVSGTFASAYGHGNQIYTFRRSVAAVYEMVTWDPSLNTFSGATNITALPDGMVAGTVVLAPEPGVMIGLAFGVVVLLRRRRR